MRTEKQREYRRNYRAKVKSLTIEFNLNETDLVEHISKQPSRPRYIKDLIRSDMARATKKEE